MAVQSCLFPLPLSAGIEQATDKQDNHKCYNIKTRVFIISLWKMKHPIIMVVYKDRVEIQVTNSGLEEVCVTEVACRRLPYSLSTLINAA